MRLHCMYVWKLDSLSKKHKVYNRYGKMAATNLENYIMVLYNVQNNDVKGNNNTTNTRVIQCFAEIHKSNNDVRSSLCFVHCLSFSSTHNRRDWVSLNLLTFLSMASSRTAFPGTALGVGDNVCQILL